VAVAPTNKSTPALKTTPPAAPALKAELAQKTAPLSSKTTSLKTVSVAKMVAPVVAHTTKAAALVVAHNTASRTTKPIALSKSAAPVLAPELSAKSVPLTAGVISAPAAEHQDSTVRIDPATGARIKTLPPSVVKDIEQKNLARRQAGLDVIHVRVRQCLTCNALFESAGNRTCGCASRAAGHMAGREII
jgi:hypothetical protein